jgi:hypothetical protein
MQGIKNDGARAYTAKQVDKRGDTLYTDRRMMLLLMDKIVKFERTDKSCRNPTITEATLAEEDGAIIEAVPETYRQPGPPSYAAAGRGRPGYAVTPQSPEYSFH